MTVELIVAASRQKNGDLGISNNNCIPWNLPEDLKHFRKITMGHIVIMGRNTFESLPHALEGRRNVVISVNTELQLKGAEVLCSFEAISLLISQQPPGKKVFIIGGSKIYQRFLDICDKIHLTEVKTYFECDNVIFGGIPSSYELTEFSHTKTHQGVSYRFLTYSKAQTHTNNEKKYLEMLKDILDTGIRKEDRTGTGTISMFGSQLRFDISGNKIPMLTTKKVPFDAIIEELLWICRGDTDAKILSNKGVKIWDDNTSREFLDSRKLISYPEGCIGPGYGFQWRHFGAEYRTVFSDSSNYSFKDIGGFDQLANVEHLLKTDPFSRRIMINAWNPPKLQEMALPPCHFAVMFYVEETNGIKYLSCHFVMRSNDVFLGLPFNIVSYSILTKILAIKCGMKAKDLLYSCTDTHIYSNHVNKVEKQLKREIRAPPVLELDESIKNKDWKDIKVSDFDLIGYIPDQGIIAKMAV